MPWCPKCRAEYRQGFTTCSDCEVGLVEELEPEEKKSAEYEYDTEAYLTNAANSIEADLIESLLKSMDIPVLKKYRETGGYLKVYMGDTLYGIDLYVPSRQLDQAKEIIRDIQFQEPAADVIQQDIDKAGNSEWEKVYSKSRRARALFILWPFILPVIIYIIGAVYNIYNWIMK